MTVTTGPSVATDAQGPRMVSGQEAGPNGPDLLTRREVIEVDPRVRAVMAAARDSGTELDPGEFKGSGKGTPPSAAELSEWAKDAGMWSQALRLKWAHLMNLGEGGPVVLLLNDGSACLMTGVLRDRNVIIVKDPTGKSGSATVPVDEHRMMAAWTGDAVLVRAERGGADADAQFNLGWLVRMVLREGKSLRDVGVASVVLSFLTVFPPMLVMTVVDKVLVHKSMSTLILLAVILGLGAVHETFLGYARTSIVLIVGNRLDAKLNLHVFNRLLRLPLDYFERHPSGETMHKIGQVYKVRDFLTGKLLTTFLDLITLLVLLPFLFYLSVPLAFIVLGCSGLIMLVILSFLGPLRRRFAKVVAAESEKASVLGETIYGIKTVKSLAIEPQRRALWDGHVAEVGKWRIKFGQLAAWPKTIVTPIERFMSSGIILVGAWMALTDTTGYAVGALFAFMMLSSRVAQPLVGLARLIEDYEEIGAAVGEAASVLNRQVEADTASGGVRPVLRGGVQFDDVTFTYEGTRRPALDSVSFSIPEGTTMGIVGRSGSGKSTVTRLLQGINREYSGHIKLDGTDLREVNLRHLRESLGVVLQENFLFRGSVSDNIISGRRGLTMDNVVLAARLAGAEEFIERLPAGYETFVQEGSPNLSGGQRQRLAIARALISDPRLVILDEATSALDPESEALVNANLKRIASGRTMVIVSHRLSSLVDCDQILVMDAGRVVDVAPHRKLLERCTIYRQLWTQQNRHLDQGAPYAVAS